MKAPPEPFTPEGSPEVTPKPPPTPRGLAENVGVTVAAVLWGREDLELPLACAVLS